MAQRIVFKNNFYILHFFKIEILPAAIISNPRNISISSVEPDDKRLATVIDDVFSDRLSFCDGVINIINVIF